MKTLYLTLTVLCFTATSHAQTPADAPAADEPAAVTSSASIAPEKRELILKFIDVFGTRAAMNQNLDAMIKSLPQDNPQVKDIQNKVKVDEIIERLVPLYDKQFSAEELQSYIDFYSSSQGKKLIEGIAVVMRGSIEVSAQYFREKLPDLEEPAKE